MTKKAQLNAGSSTEDSAQQIDMALSTTGALFRQIADYSEESKWFPHGVTKIDFQIKAGPVELHVIVNGPDGPAPPHPLDVATQRSARLIFDQVKDLVPGNNRSGAFTDECVIAVCWKESSFDPSAQSGGSTAAGLMQMTNPAITTVNKITPAGVHFEHDDMFVPAKAIQCGTYYLQYLYEHADNDEAKALDRYGTGAGYSKNVIAAETCQRKPGSDPMTCLGQIHSFLLDRLQRGLIDDPTGRSRFIAPGKTESR